jgi:DNA-directed RNA polymerase I, II, and III subunit RPABC1
MEDTALKIIQSMLERRDIKVTEAKAVEVPKNVEGMDKTRVYNMGPVLVIFSTKERGINEKDIQHFTSYSGNNAKAGTIVVTMTPPSESILKVIKSKAKSRMQFFHIKQLQFDITSHRMAMPHRILKEEELKRLYEKFKISQPDQQLPWIDSQDPMAKWIGAIPGDVIEVNRHSDVAGQQLFYRYCVEDVNIA